MAGAELAPKLEIHKEGEGNVLKTFGEKSDELRKQYAEVQQTYADLKAKLNKLQERRWGGVRGPELDENAAKLVKQGLEDKLQKMAEEFRAKVNEHNQAVKEGLRQDSDTTSAEVALGNIKSTLNSLLSSELQQLVDEAKNPEAMAKRMSDKVTGGIAKRNTALDDAMNIR